MTEPSSQVKHGADYTFNSLNVPLDKQEMIRYPPMLCFYDPDNESNHNHRKKVDAKKQRINMAL